MIFPDSLDSRVVDMLKKIRKNNNILPKVGIDFTKTVRPVPQLMAPRA
jgi:hypothetical protein